MKSIHFKAFAIWALYSLVTKGVFLIVLPKAFNLYFAFITNTIFDILFGVIFLYLFSHEDFFKFARQIERENQEKEGKLIKKFKHFGKIFSSLAATVIGGPMIGALAVRFLLPKYQYRYLLIGLFSALSATIWLGIGKGLISIRLPF